LSPTEQNEPWGSLFGVGSLFHKLKQEQEVRKRVEAKKMMKQEQ